HRQRLLVMAERRLDLWVGADRMVEVHRAAAGQHERVGDPVRDELISHPVRQLHFGHSPHPFHRAVRTIASSRPTVGATPNSFLIFCVSGTYRPGFQPGSSRPRISTPGAPSSSATRSASSAIDTDSSDPTL